MGMTSNGLACSLLISIKSTRKIYDDGLFLFNTRQALFVIVNVIRIRVIRKYICGIIFFQSTHTGVLSKHIGLQLVDTLLVIIIIIFIIYKAHISHRDSS